MSEVKKESKKRLIKFPFISGESYLLKMANGSYCVGEIYENGFDESLTGEAISEQIEAYIPLKELIDEQ